MLPKNFYDIKKAWCSNKHSTKYSVMWKNENDLVERHLYCIYIRDIYMQVKMCTSTTHIITHIHSPPYIHCHLYSKMKIFSSYIVTWKKKKSTKKNIEKIFILSSFFFFFNSFHFIVYFIFLNIQSLIAYIGSHL